MTAAVDETIQALREEVSELKLRAEELGEENRVLRDICTTFGLQYEERLAVSRHNRYFARLCAEHPIGEAAAASDVLGAAPIVRGISACAGAVFWALNKSNSSTMYYVMKTRYNNM